MIALHAQAPWELFKVAKGFKESSHHQSANCLLSSSWWGWRWRSSMLSCNHSANCLVFSGWSRWRWQWWWRWWNDSADDDDDDDDDNDNDNDNGTLVTFLQIVCCPPQDLFSQWSHYSPKIKTYFKQNPCKSSHHYQQKLNIDMMIWNIDIMWEWISTNMMAPCNDWSIISNK